LPGRWTFPSDGQRYDEIWLYPTVVLAYPSGVPDPATAPKLKLNALNMLCCSIWGRIDTAQLKLHPELIGLAVG